MIDDIICYHCSVDFFDGALAEALDEDIVNVFPYLFYF